MVPHLDRVVVVVVVVVVDDVDDVAVVAVTGSSSLSDPFWLFQVARQAASGVQERQRNILCLAQYKPTKSKSTNFCTLVAWYPLHGSS